MSDTREGGDAFKEFMRVSAIETRKTGDSIYWEVSQPKEYPRFARISLPRLPSTHTLSLADSLSRRQSADSFSSSPITVSHLSQLLELGSGKQHRPDKTENYRVYPSAGARYPIEIYPAVLNCTGVEPGLYHYVSHSHALESLWKKDLTKRLVLATNDKRIQLAGAVIILTGVYGRTTEKYGVRGYRYVLLEAGHIAQNLSLAAAALNIECRCIGGFIDSELNAILDLGTQTEEVLYLVAVGTRCQATDNPPD